MEVPDFKDEKPIFELYYFTDPICVWCWGSEPVVRKIKELYGSQVRIVYKMGGLIESVKTFQDTVNDIHGGNFYEKMGEYWEMAAARHKMPIDSGFFAEFNTDFRSSWPTCLAVKAAQMQDWDKAALYVRRLREAGMAERRPIHRRDVQMELAEEVGLDPNELKEDIDSGAAGHAFDADMQEYHTHGGESFPFYILRHLGGDEIPLNGYVSSMTLDKMMTDMAGDDLVRNEPELSDEGIVSFVEEYGRVAVREVGELYLIPLTEAQEHLDRLVEEGKLTRQEAGNGYFYSVA